ncbi:nucleolar protein dao-5 [Trifolium repens]|nr:nucleolar protein dao-5 [Trifolium repens]
MASANKELEEEVIKAGNKLFDPPSVEDLLRLLFETGVPWEYYPEKVFSSMKTIMVLVLEEGDLSEDTALNLLSPILDSLNNDNEVVLPIAPKLGESVLQSCPTQLKIYLRQSPKEDCSSIIGSDSVSS